MYRRLSRTEYASEGRAAFERGLTIQEMSELARTISDDGDCSAYIGGYLAARREAEDPSPGLDPRALSLGNRPLEVSGQPADGKTAFLGAARGRGR